MPVEILCAGDLHGFWDDVDRAFVESGSQDLVVFVGDLGHNDPRIVREIASLACPTFVLLGNHDAWDEMLGRRVELAAAAMQSLGDAFGGFRARAIAGGRMAIAGGRPFSWGGGWRAEYGSFYARHFGLDDDAQSAEKIINAANELGDVPLILAGHQGPAGLGARRDSIFGRDFELPPIDFGDVDLRIALDRLRRTRPVVATLAGHMHVTLQGGGSRVRAVREGGTLHVNAAVVPRHIRGLRHFVRLRISDDLQSEASDIWIDDRGSIARVTALEIEAHS